jgi:hypothetical protein
MVNKKNMGHLFQQCLGYIVVGSCMYGGNPIAGENLPTVKPFEVMTST